MGQVGNRMDHKELITKIEQLEYNSMCYDCKLFQNECAGSKNKIYSGCVRREKDNSKQSIYAKFLKEAQTCEL